VTLYLTAQQIVAIHDAEVDPDEPPGVDLGLVASAAGRPRQTVFGEDAYPTLHLKAAALLHSLVCNHPFVSGNKRTATLAVHTFYAINGYELTAEPGTIVALMLAVAQSYVETDRGSDGELEEIAARLEMMVEPIKHDDPAFGLD
jgi:death-on-curing protein